MASVQELIALAEHEANTRNPGARALSNVLAGFQQSQNNDLERVKNLIAIDEHRKAMERAQEEDKQARAMFEQQQENSLKAGMIAAGTPGRPVMPKQKLKTTISRDSSGLMRRGYELVESNEEPKKSASSVYTLDDEEMAALTKAMQRKDNPLPVSIIKTRGPGAKIMARALIDNPDYIPTATEIAFATSKAASTSEARSASSAIGRLEPAMKSLDDFLDYAEPYVQALSPTQIQAVNAAYTKGLLQINDPDANALLTHLNEATGQYAQILKGGTASPTDEDFKKAREVLRLGLSSRGFGAVSEAIKKATHSKVKRLREQIAGAKSGKTDLGTEQERITVSNGTETFEIDAADLPEAEADGFKVVR